MTVGAGSESRERAWRAGRSTYAGLALDRADFDAFLARLDGVVSPEARHDEDLYLACACLARVPGAAETLFARYLERVPMYLGRHTLPPDLVADVQQQLAERLMFGQNGRPPLLSSYTGRGTLEGFVRVSANRLAVDLQRGAARQPRSYGGLADSQALAEDLELQLLKETYREPFRVAFVAAAAALRSEHRALLRQHYVDGLTTAQLARMRRVSRATIIRRIAEAREELVAGMKEHLRATIGLADAEFESFLGLVRSQLDLSLMSLLRQTAA
jgi:RNA polymerase sigma-70 factor (ECF subfamily)